MSTQLSLEGAVQVLKNGAAQVQKGFTNPDDDWMGVMMLQGRDGRIHYMPYTFEDEFEKELMTEGVVPMLIKEMDAWFVGQVLSAWTVKVPNPGNTIPENPQTYAELDIVPPSQHPDRVEVLILTAFTADQEQMWMAKIRRHPQKPPTLAPWKLQQGYVSNGGRFVDPIKLALQRGAEA